MSTPNYGWPTPLDTGFVKDGAAAIRDLGDAADATVADLAATAVPLGAIMLWSGSLTTVPTGWQLCDGTNGTPDLRDRFVMGASGTTAPGSTGGTHETVLTTAQLPEHAHAVGSMAVNVDGAHDHAFSATSSLTGGHDHSAGTYKADSNGAHTHTIPARQFTTTESTEQENTRLRASSAAGSLLNFSSMNSAGAHTHAVSGNSGSVASHRHTLSGTTASSPSHSHGLSGNTAAVGSGDAIDNRPPYLALAYIMRVA